MSASLRPTALLCMLVVSLGMAGCSRSPDDHRTSGMPTGPSVTTTQVTAKQGSKPRLAKVKITPIREPQPDRKSRFTVTGTVVDADNDVAGGQIRLNLSGIGILVGRIVQIVTTSSAEGQESVTADVRPGGFESASLNGTQLQAVFFLDKRPKQTLKASVIIQDVAGNRSNEVRTTAPPPPPDVTRFDGRYSGAIHNDDSVAMSLTVSNGRITVTAGGLAGSGTVDANGGASFEASGKDDRGNSFSCGFSGQFRENSASGSFRCTKTRSDGSTKVDTGPWNVTRVG